MASKTLSSFRLHSKTISINENIELNNRIFSILKSSNSESLVHFYVLDAKWQHSGDQIIPLAHLVISSRTGNIKFNIFQPEVFNLKIDLNILSNIIINFACPSLQKLA